MKPYPYRALAGRSSGGGGERPARKEGWGAIPAGIWALGLVSMLMDISSEMIHALLPVYMVSVLGVSGLAVGVIEGVAEATASITKIFSGTLSDWLGRRKSLAVVGYGLAALTKPVFALATTLDGLIVARFVDRIGKGIRGAPRDALVADLSPPELRGACYGLRQSLDMVGALSGPLLAIGLMGLLADDFQVVFWLAVIPAFLAVVVLVIGVREPTHTKESAKSRVPLRFRDLRQLPAAYWWVVGVSAVFTLSRFSEAFLVLRAHSLGLPVTLAPIVLVVMGLAYCLSAYPAGVFSDRVNRKVLLAVGLCLLVLADVILAWAADWVWLGVGVVLWGIHMGFTQGVLSALVADAAPKDLRGTAFGIFNLMSGGALLGASVLAGALWDGIGPAGTFLAGAGFATLTLVGLACLHRRAERD